MQTLTNNEQECIRIWAEALRDSFDRPHLHNFCDDVKAKWPYISVTAPENFESYTMAENATWARGVHRVLAQIIDVQDFVVVAYRKELVIGFQNIATAVAAKLQIQIKDDFYKVTYGW